MTPTESDSKKQSQEEKRFSPEVNIERPKRSKRSIVNSPKPRSTVRESLTRNFEEEPCLDGGEEPMAKIVKMETDKERVFFQSEIQLTFREFRILIGQMRHILY